MAILGGVLLLAFLAVLWVEHNAPVELPAPSGPFAVGRSTYVWSDAAYADSVTPQPGTKRELLAWIWYPAAPPKPSQPTADYLPVPWRTAVERHGGVLLTQFLTRDLSRVRAHSFHDVAVSPQQRSYPVVLMRAGLAALVTGYTSLAQDLASHGYVVVGFDAPYRSSVVVFPDGRVITRAPQNNAELVSGSEQEQLANKLVQAWSADLGFALDQLERLNVSDPSGRFRGRLDMQRVGVFGHSLGGATALQFCHDDPRCKAGVDIDGAPLGSVIAQGVTQPFLFLMSDLGSESAAETRTVEANIRSIYDRLPPDRRLQMTIRGANHYLFSDDGALLKSHIVLRSLRAVGILGIDGRRQLAITAYCVHSFLTHVSKEKALRGSRFDRHSTPRFNGRREMTSKGNRSLGLLRAAALIAVMTGAAGSVGLMLYAGRHNNSRLLLSLFALWVLSPFMLLIWANAVQGVGRCFGERCSMA